MRRVSIGEGFSHRLSPKLEINPVSVLYHKIGPTIGHTKIISSWEPYFPSSFISPLDNRAIYIYHNLFENIKIWDKFSNGLLENKIN